MAVAAAPLADAQPPLPTHDISPTVHYTPCLPACAWPAPMPLQRPALDGCSFFIFPSTIHGLYVLYRLASYTTHCLSIRAIPDTACLPALRLPCYAADPPTSKLRASPAAVPAACACPAHLPRYHHTTRTPRTPHFRRAAPAHAALHHTYPFPHTYCARPIRATTHTRHLPPHHRTHHTPLNTHTHGTFLPHPCLTPATTCPPAPTFTTTLPPSW